MTIWEKAILNMQKGTQKLSAAAAIFSERVRAEINITRLRIRMKEVSSLIDEQYRIIGRRVLELKNADSLPRTADELVADEAITAAAAEIEARRRDFDDLQREIESEQDAFKPEQKQKGGAA